MLLDLQGGDLEAVGDVNVALPGYMTLLTDVERRAAQGEPFPHHLVVAAGRDPDDGRVVMLTADDKLIVIDPIEHGLPRGPVTPADGGYSLSIANDEFVSCTFKVLARWVIQRSQSLGVTLSPG